MDTPTTATSANLLRVGVTPDSPPLISKDQGAISGLEADLARRLASFLNRQVQFIEIPWAQQIEALEAGKIDIIMSGMSITRTRQFRIAFSNPYLLSGQIMLVPLEKRQQFSNGISSLMGGSHTIGVITDTTGDLLVTGVIHGAKVKRFSTPELAVKALRNNDIEAFVYDAPMICHYAAHNENRLTPILVMASEEPLAWGIRKQDTELLNQTNQFLNQIRNSRELTTIIHKWIPYM